jgi:hypothetical protein
LHRFSFASREATKKKFYIVDFHHCHHSSNQRDVEMPPWAVKTKTMRIINKASAFLHNHVVPSHTSKNFAIICYSHQYKRLVKQANTTKPQMPPKLECTSRSKNKELLLYN